MINKITTLIPKPERDFIYDILPRFQPALCVDIGAAVGEATQRIHKALISGGRIVSFEPFPGNAEIFRRQCAQLENVVLVQKAVSDRIGEARLVVPSIVKGTEAGWEGFEGYSGVAHLSSAWSESSTLNHLERKLRTIARTTINLFKGIPPPQMITVNTTTLDHEFAAERINFLKVDVQGAEGQVLAGGRALLSSRAIELAYIEWSGEPAIIEQLTSNGYQLFDSTYVVGTDKANLNRLRDWGFDILHQVNLSTGKIAFDMALTEKGISPEAAIHKVGEIPKTWIQTDLIAVAEPLLPAFNDATKELAHNTSSS